MPEIDKKKLFEKNPIFKKTRVSLKTAVFHAIYLKNCSWMNIYNYTSNIIEYRTIHRHVGTNHDKPFVQKKYATVMWANATSHDREWHTKMVMTVRLVMALFYPHSYTTIH